jgi:bifunctional enzyme CysN/CysC
MNAPMATASRPPKLRPRAISPNRSEKSLLRFLTCGSVDDGKSTLIGRLALRHQADLRRPARQPRARARKHGTTGEDVDFASAGRRARSRARAGHHHRRRLPFLFATDKRKFIVADTPGHEQYTRNMATGASTADLAIVLIDARQGVLRQTRRHSIHRLAARHQAHRASPSTRSTLSASTRRVRRIDCGVPRLRQGTRLRSLACHPDVGAKGDNITGARTDELVFMADADRASRDGSSSRPTAARVGFRFPVQYVNRPNLDFRGFCRHDRFRRSRRGDDIVVAKSGKPATVKRIVAMAATCASAIAGQAVTLVLEDEVEVSRGNLLVSPDARPDVPTSSPPMSSGSTSRRCCRGAPTSAHRDRPGKRHRHRAEVPHQRQHFAHEAAKSLEMNEVGVCNISTQSPIAFDSFAENRTTGAFILIDRISNATFGAGMILHRLRRSAKTSTGSRST